MPNVGQVEKAIERVEGFAVRVLHPGGRDVRSDRANLPRYGSLRALGGDRTVSEWKTLRFARQYSGWDVEVLDERGRAVHGGTKLATVRSSYG